MADAPHPELYIFASLFSHPHVRLCGYVLCYCLVTHTARHSPSVYTKPRCNVKTARRPLTLCWAGDGICWWSDLYTTLRHFRLKPLRLADIHGSYTLRTELLALIYRIININEGKHAQFHYLFFCLANSQ